MNQHVNASGINYEVRDSTPNCHLSANGNKMPLYLFTIMNLDKVNKNSYLASITNKFQSQVSVTQQLLDDQPNKRSSSKEKPIQFKMCCCGCIKDICDCACGLLTWVISTIVSVIVLGGIISLILWLVGVFDGEETTTVSPATVAAAEGVVRSFAGTNPSIQFDKTANLTNFEYSSIFKQNSAWLWMP